MLGLILCDDNKRHLELLEKYMLEIIVESDLQAKVELVTSDPQEVLRYHYDKNGDALLVYVLDIDFGTGVTGLDIAKEIRKRDRLSYMVFLTAHMEYLQLSLKVKVFDFLVKPVSKTNLKQVLLSLNQDIEALTTARTEANTIALVSGARTYIVRIPDIVYCERDGAVVSVQTVNQRIQCYKTIKELEVKLQNKHFIRCHKSFLVNMSYVTEYLRSDRMLELGDGHKIPVSRHYRRNVLDYVDYHN